jgi:hypothetical protein
MSSLSHSKRPKKAKSIKKNEQCQKQVAITDVESPEINEISNSASIASAKDQKLKRMKSNSANFEIFKISSNESVAEISQIDCDELAEKKSAKAKSTQAKLKKRTSREFKKKSKKMKRNAKETQEDVMEIKASKVAVPSRVSQRRVCKLASDKKQSFPNCLSNIISFDEISEFHFQKPIKSIADKSNLKASFESISNSNESNHPKASHSIEKQQEAQKSDSSGDSAAMLPLSCCQETLKNLSELLRGMHFKPTKLTSVHKRLKLK